MIIFIFLFSQYDLLQNSSCFVEIVLFWFIKSEAFDDIRIIGYTMLILILEKNPDFMK